MFSNVLRSKTDFIKIVSSNNYNVIEPYKGIFWAGYIVLGLTLLAFLGAVLFNKLVTNKPKFIKYENNTE